MKLTILLVLLCLLKDTKSERISVDPWPEEEYEDPVKKNVETDKIIASLKNTGKAVPESEQLSADDVFFYYNRLIKTIFAKQNFKLDEKTGSFFRSLHLHVSEDEFTIFNNSEKSIENLRKLDGIITDIIEESHGGTSEILYDLFENWMEIFHYYIDSIFVRVGGCLLLVLIAVITLKKVFALQTFGLLSILFLITSYCWTYYSMYNELEVKRMLELTKYENQPPECDSRSLSIFTTIKQFLFRGFTKDNCEEYWMKISMSTWQSLDPGAVAVEMITRLFTQPITTFSSRIGMGLTLLFDAVPFPLNLIIFPIGTIMLFLLIIYFGSFILGIPVNLNFMHLIQFRTGHDQHSRVYMQTEQGALAAAPPSLGDSLLQNALLKLYNQPATSTQQSNRRRFSRDEEQKTLGITHATFKTKSHKKVRRNPAIMPSNYISRKRIFRQSGSSDTSIVEEGSSRFEFL